jgi:hypothetical protein
MLVKTNELSGAQLDWAVAKCEGNDGVWYETDKDPIPFTPSTDWAQGGPIIERERIDVMWGGDRWCAYTMTPDGETQLQTEGPTPLIAAMRGYVLSKLGFEVEVHHALA